jgi:hypothetical protein
MLGPGLRNFDCMIGEGNGFVADAVNFIAE